MILVQSIVFVIPSILVGYAISLPCIKYLYGYLFSSSPNVNLSIIPTARATFLAIILGLVIPLLSSIIPIRSALSKNLNECLTSNRSKTSGVIITEVNKNSAIGPYLLFGSISVVSGIAIYYLMPLAVLK